MWVAGEEEVVEEDEGGDGVPGVVAVSSQLVYLLVIISQPTYVYVVPSTTHSPPFCLCTNPSTTNPPGLLPSTNSPQTQSTHLLPHPTSLLTLSPPFGAPPSLNAPANSNAATPVNEVEHAFRFVHGGPSVDTCHLTPPPFAASHPRRQNSTTCAARSRYVAYGRPPAGGGGGGSTRCARRRRIATCALSSM